MWSYLSQDANTLGCAKSISLTGINECLVISQTYISMWKSTHALSKIYIWDLSVLCLTYSCLFSTFCICYETQLTNTNIVKDNKTSWALARCWCNVEVMLVQEAVSTCSLLCLRARMSNNWMEEESSPMISAPIIALFLKECDPI